MWENPWKFKEGFVICGGLIVAGLLLQWLLGPLDWSLAVRPYNFILLGLLVFLTVLGHALSGRFYALEWMAKATAAVPTLLTVSLLAVVMGLTRQVAPHSEPTDALGLTRMLGFWPFVLVYVYAIYQVGLAVMTTVMRWRMGAPLWRALLFGSSHLGLWLAMVCATLGSGDMIRVKMVAQEGVTDNQGVDDRHRLVALPFSVKLEDFGIEQYAPDMTVADRRSGLPAEETGWEITAFDTLEWAVPAETDSAVAYAPARTYGATSAMLVGARKDGKVGVGWISSGNFMYPPQSLFLDADYAVVMEEPRPKRYYSAVEVHTKDGQTLRDTVEVNRPMKVNRWWIYQLAYDEAKGRWSRISILEMVRDPWLHSVYAGFILMLLGAVLLLLPKNRVELWRSGVAVSVMAVVAFAFIYITLVSVGYFERKMMPALHSPWFGPHIVVYMVGYSCLALATVAALFRRQAIADLLVRPGLSFLTFGMLFGAFWAKEAWGTYWSWDPKETWAAATWTLYVAYLHLRASRPKAQGAAAVLLIVAFVCLQMCWWGVNYLPSAQATSVHTYTS